MVHPTHLDWVNPALSPSSQNGVKMSEIQRSKTRMVTDTDPLPDEVWPRNLDFKIHPGKGCLRRLWWRPVESWVAGKEHAEVHSLFFLQESWGSTREAAKPLLQQDQKMFFIRAELENLAEYVVDIKSICVGEGKEQIQRWRWSQIRKNPIHFE